MTHQRRQLQQHGYHGSDMGPLQSSCRGPCSTWLVNDTFAITAPFVITAAGLRRGRIVACAV